MRKYYIAVAALALFAIGAYGLYYVVSKDKIADQTTMDDIQQLQEKITSYVDKNKRLPASLNDLDLAQQKVGTRLSKYTYTAQGLRTTTQYSFPTQSYVYQICATFIAAKSATNSYSSADNFDSSAGHKQGRDCFSLKTNAP